MTTADEVRQAIAPKPTPEIAWDGVDIGDKVIVTPNQDSPLDLQVRAGQTASVFYRVNAKDLVLEFPSGCQILASRNEVARVD